MGFICGAAYIELPLCEKCNFTKTHTDKSTMHGDVFIPACQINTTWSGTNTLRRGRLSLRRPRTLFSAHRRGKKATNVGERLVEAQRFELSVQRLINLPQRH